MRTLPSHIATTVLVAIYEGKVHMIFTWSSNGTHIAPFENNDIHFHLHTSFPVILYPGHFVPKSFHTQVVSRTVGHVIAYSILALLDVYQRSFTEVDISGICLFVHPVVCLSVNMFVDGLEYFSALAQFDIEGKILTKFKKKSLRKCDNKKMSIDRWIDGRTDRRMPERSPSEMLLWTVSRRANDQGAICPGYVVAKLVTVWQGLKDLLAIESWKTLYFTLSGA